MKANFDQRQIMRCNYSMNNNEMGGQTKRIEYCKRQNCNVTMNAKNTLNLLYYQHQISTRFNFNADEAKNNLKL